MSREKPSLEAHEWMAVVTAFFFAASVFGICLVSSPEIEQELFGEAVDAMVEEIEVVLEGAVENPGHYCLPKGSLVKDLLEKAILTKDADLSSLKLDSKLRRGRLVKVPSKGKVTVTIKGAVATPGAMTFPKGTKLQDLASFVTFKENADTQILNKKRLLKDGEIIWIAEQKHLHKL